ncbi:MAG: Resolvase [Candidatus Wolfebacteria bacterium GW2011_GWC2_46_275]|uniref:Resolvase n=2 Tax=Candidatus Wolfeibacteriota TaxID=1752735 RepID=A0A0G1U8T8_9BACT|nr:MAG: resolvase [Candidatus Wolfebacteria bacterium GW2011_GWB1_47_1]KKU36187.1 MAG: Resolvase [Candidatus Wolfebacteria bacterium GW2011_GWC2_46_275]KKU42096.1 MAG: Resolvase [Candidatus Wolfebacteria bacterium GW2011_GWB2_46_69]KKU59315.1 MAG: Resolvase [Candidatus Wolfebacteria bacterium GW2011_GWE2_47_12]KKU90542.1 MAG: Resolvase [Candidatus Wolfebacteria bacterium GW2011_GWA2_47_9b]HAL24898.1 recombinase family protein [Candidatus Wolfebacteria bacterium]
MKSIIYARVSSKEQEETGYSLPSQEKLLRDYADRKELAIAKTFSIAESASGVKQRKVFGEMIKLAENNKINNILCEKVDRLTRNLKEAVMVNEWLEEDELRKIHFVKQNLIIHKNAKSDEKFRWDIEIILAKKYISNLSEEVKKGQKEKIAQGWLPTAPVMGYKTVGDKGHRIHVIDPTAAPVAQKMFELYATGNFSISVITSFVKESGVKTRAGRPIVKTRIHQLLSDPFYYGKIQWNDKLYPGKHDPLITKELFDEVQRMLKRGTKAPAYQKHFPIFKGKIFCGECGGTITWEVQKGHWYGHCNHYKPCAQKKYTKQGSVEDQLFAYFSEVAPKNEQVLQWLEKALKADHRSEIDYRTSAKDNLLRDLERIEKRFEGLYDDKLDGKILPAFYERKAAEFTEQKETLVQQLANLNKSQDEYYEAGYAIHELALKSRSIYSSPHATTEEKRLLLSYIFSNITIKDGEIKPEYTSAFEFMSKWMPIVNNTFELENVGINTNEKGTFVPSRTILLRTMDEFRTLNWSSIENELRFSGILSFFPSAIIQNQF